MDALERAHGILALYNTISEHGVLASHDMSAEFEARISERTAAGDQASTTWLLAVREFLAECRAYGVRAAFSRYFARNELVVPQQLQERYSAYVVATERDDRGLSDLRQCPSNYLPIFEEMFERQIVRLKIDGDLFWHRTLEERLAFLRACVSGSPPPPRPARGSRQPLPFDDDEPEIAALYRAAKQSAQSFVQHGNAQGIDEGLGLIAKALLHPRWNEASPSLRDQIREGRASLLASRYREVDGRDEDISSAIAIWTDLATTSNDPELVRSAIANCSLALLWQAERSGLPERTDKSIEIMRQITIGAHNGTASANLASLALQRYDALGGVSDLELAAVSASEAIAYSDIGDRALPAALLTLSDVFGHRHAQSKNPEHLELALRYANDAVTLLDGHSFDARQHARSLTVLGNHLRALYEVEGKPEYLDRAIALLERAVSMIPVESASHLHTAVDLAKALAATPRTDPRAQIRTEHSIGLLRRLHDEHGFGPQDTLFVSDALAQALFSHWRLTGTVKSRDEAFALWDKIVGHEAASRHPSWALVAARNRGLFALEQGDWATAAESLSRAITLVEELVLRNVVRRHRDVTLRQTFGVASLAAYAFAQQGKAMDAAMMLERGRAFSLSYALGSGEQELRRLAKAGRTDLSAALQRASAALGFAESADRMGDASTAAEDLARVIEDIRGIPGFEGFLRLPTPEGVFSDLALPIVYLAATGFGGVAVLIQPRQAPEALALPELTEERLLSFLQPLYGAEDRTSAPAMDLNAPSQIKQLDEVLAWLWKACIGPVLEQLAGTDEVVVVPTGYLGVLPLQAAWRNGVSGSSDREYALDRLAVMFAPNARTLRTCLSRTLQVYDRGSLLVGDPLPSRAPRLNATSAELHEVAALLAGSEIIAGEGATAEIILNAVSDRRLFHFAGHAFSDQDDPLESFLLAAGDERLTARRIFAAAPKRIRLVVLSACETAVPDFRHVDEVVSLATALIQAGAAGVIASQWRVNDAATMMLSIEFYKRWRDGMGSPHRALAEAQRWMHASSPQEKRDTYATLLDTAGISLRDADWLRYSHPFYWAAFTYWGA